MTPTNFTTSLTDKLAAAWPPEKWRDVTVIVAVSGGGDSVALARALVELRQPGEGRLVLAHFNHRLRGPDSDEDQAFVQQLAYQLDLHAIVGSAPSPTLPIAPSPPRPLASEESLRSLRYEFLGYAAGQVGARYVVTAHTADDQVETVLANFLRGTGLAGLAGIPRVRQLTAATTLIRPLLEVTRADVIDFLRQIEQPFREDASNAALDYTRNRIRHELLPLLACDYSPHVREAILRLSRLAGEADDEITGLAADLAGQLVQPISGGVEIPVERLLGMSNFLARSLLRAAWRSQGWPEQGMGLAEWEALLELARDPIAAPGTFPGAIRAVSAGGVLRLTRP